MAAQDYEQVTYNGASGAQVGSSASEKIAFHGATPTDQPAALTTQLTTITIADAAGTPDYALQALTTSTPYGLATAAEAITLMYVVKNLQVRMLEVEALLEEKGLVAAN